MKKKIPKKTHQQHPAARGLAAQVLQQVHADGRSLSTALPQFSHTLAASQQPFLHELCYGSLRWFIRLDAILKQLLNKPLRAKERLVYYLLIIGLYQLIYSNKPDYAVVQETVAELQRLNKGWAKGLVNAILRGFLREQEKILAGVDQKMTQQYAHPDWLVDTLRQDWRQQLDLEQISLSGILSANNHYPPFWIRLNKLQCSVSEYQTQLSQLDNDYQFLDPQLDACKLSQAYSVESIPGFTQGWVSVQDGAAQYAAHILNAQIGERILDVCAAPGGKTAHILQLQPQLEHLLAIDISAKRLQQVKENLQRCALTAELKVADATQPQEWWDGNHFDRILLDAPCSASGVIRRHPDIKVLRRPEDIHTLVKIQQQILNTTWKMLKPGGTLVYATCSILRNENDRQLSRFLAAHNDAKEDKIHLQVGRAMPVGWQIFPGEADLDGFYYAKINKQT